MASLALEAVARPCPYPSFSGTAIYVGLLVVLTSQLTSCFGSPPSPGSGSGSGGERPQNGGRARWRRRVAAAGEFRYDPLSYALNFDDGASDDAEDAAFRYRNFSSRLPPSPSLELRPLLL
ncbi:hypothetical protein ZWY2020_000517 [Hordeum vulgare]|nr:hypothetical protein ZWY2020_000517 [Hordeum vulgare]